MLPRRLLTLGQFRLLISLHPVVLILEPLHLLVLVTKYRRQVITTDVLQRLGEIFEATCTKWRCTLKEFHGESDHVHLVISFPPDVQVSTLVGNLKTVSSRLIRKEFADWTSKFYRKPVFWSGAYFVASCGGVTLEHLKQYVDSQARLTPRCR